MSIKKETYICDSIRKLIDLNQDVVNFHLEFTITSKEGEEFYVCIVDQNTLNNKKELEYKKAKGSISGSVTQDKDVYQNYFLVLKADKPTEVDVEINFKKINPVIAENPKEQYEQPLPRMPNNQLMPAKSQKKMPWAKILLFTGIIVAAGGVIYYFFVYKKKKAGNMNLPKSFSFSKSENTPPVENPPEKPSLAVSESPKKKSEPVKESKSPLKSSPSSSETSSSETSKPSPVVNVKSHKKQPVYKPYDTKKDMLNKLRNIHKN